MYVEVRLITNQIRLLHSVELESEKCRVVRLVVGQHHEHVQPSSKSEVNLCKVTKLEMSQSGKLSAATNNDRK